MENNPSETQNEHPGGYISKLYFNNGETLDILQNDIVIFVGPNNAGKSQALRDLFELSDRKNNPIIITDINIIKRTYNLNEFLSKISTVTEENGVNTFRGVGYHLTLVKNQPASASKTFGGFRAVFVCFLDTVSRLNIASPVSMISRASPKGHPIHLAAYSVPFSKWLSVNFRRAFGNDLIPNIFFGSNIPLCIGPQVKLDQEYETEQDRIDAYARILDTYKHVDEQGDGIRSFTGILLHLMVDYYCTFLIDEPESFLHPPQANILGRIIGETLTDHQQAFISTHSEEVIKGLMSVCPERIKIVRITRKDDTNSFSVLDNEGFIRIWSDPLLKYSNIMSSLFHTSVVLCESDSDCKMYSLIESHLKRLAGQYSETLFIHSGGKQRMAKIAIALKSLDIDVKLIPDIDVLNDESIFKGIVEAFGIEWDVISRDYRILVSNLHSNKEVVNRNESRNIVNRILDSSQVAILSKLEIDQINMIFRTESKWAQIKKGGVANIPSGDAHTAYKRMNSILCDNGIFLVPVGELECFIKEVGGHGPDWTNRVLETYPNLDDPIYNGIKEFIASTLI